MTKPREIHACKMRSTVGHRELPDRVLDKIFLNVDRIDFKLKFEVSFLHDVFKGLCVILIEFDQNQIIFDDNHGIYVTICRQVQD
jgi:hypothetical protein